MYLHSTHEKWPGGVRQWAGHHHHYRQGRVHHTCLPVQVTSATVQVHYPRTAYVVSCTRTHNGTRETSAKRGRFVLSCPVSSRPLFATSLSIEIRIQSSRHLVSFHDRAGSCRAPWSPHRVFPRYGESETGRLVRGLHPAGVFRLQSPALAPAGTVSAYPIDRIGFTIHFAGGLCQVEDSAGRQTRQGPLLPRKMWIPRERDRPTGNLEMRIVDGVASVR